MSTNHARDDWADARTDETLRRELDARRPADVPEGPTHAARVAAVTAERGEFDDAYRFETGDNWTGLRAEDAKEARR